MWFPDFEEQQLEIKKITLSSRKSSKKDKKVSGNVAKKMTPLEPRTKWKC